MHSSKRRRRNKRIKIFSGIIIIIVFLAISVLWGGNRSLPQVNSNSDVLDRLQLVAESGGQAKLKAEDMNYLVRLADTNELKKQGLTIRGIYFKINKDELTTYIPVKYKGIGLLISSRDKLTYDNNFIILKTLGFKAGIVPLPQSSVMEMLRKISNKNIIIDQRDNSIRIDKNILPIKIKGIAIKDDFLTVDVPRIDIVKSIDKIIDDESTKLGITNEIKTSVSSSTSIKTGKKTGKNSSGSSKGMDRTKILMQASGQLSAAASSITSSAGRRIIRIAQSTVNKMISNPNYKYQRDLFSAKSIYDKLSPTDKEKLKTSILTKVNTKELMKIYMKKE